MLHYTLQHVLDSCKGVFISLSGSVLYLSHLLDFGASFADEGATLAGRDDQPQGHWGLTGGRTVAHRVDYILWGRGGAKAKIIRSRHSELQEDVVGKSCLSSA